MRRVALCNAGARQRNVARRGRLAAAGNRLLLSLPICMQHAYSVFPGMWLVSRQRMATNIGSKTTFIDSRARRTKLARGVIYNNGAQRSACPRGIIKPLLARILIAFIADVTQRNNSRATARYRIFARSTCLSAWRAQRGVT